MRHARDTRPDRPQPVDDVVLEFEAWIETLTRAQRRAAGEPAPEPDPALPED